MREFVSLASCGSSGEIVGRVEDHTKQKKNTLHVKCNCYTPFPCHRTRYGLQQSRTTSLSRDLHSANTVSAPTHQIGRRRYIPQRKCQTGKPGGYRATTPKTQGITKWHDATQRSAGIRQQRVASNKYCMPFVGGKLKS